VVDCGSAGQRVRALRLLPGLLPTTSRYGDRGRPTCNRSALAANATALLAGIEMHILMSMIIW
jgi:hypothetical protein